MHVTHGLTGQSGREQGQVLAGPQHPDMGKWNEQQYVEPLEKQHNVLFKNFEL